MGSYLSSTGIQDALFICTFYHECKLRNILLLALLIRLHVQPFMPSVQSVKRSKIHASCFSVSFQPQNPRALGIPRRGGVWTCIHKLPLEFPKSLVAAYQQKMAGVHEFWNQTEPVLPCCWLCEIANWWSKMAPLASPVYLVHYLSGCYKAFLPSVKLLL